MSILTDLKSIYSGIKKARRDYVKIMAFTAEHTSRHKANPSYDCGPWRKDFWDNLGFDVHPEINMFEAAAYRSMVLRYHERDKKRHPERTPSGGGLVGVEMDGTETPEQVMEKIKKAVLTDMEFQKVVADVADPKKKGKD